jgi:hypothetical protein
MHPRCGQLILERVRLTFTIFLGLLSCTGQTNTKDSFDNCPTHEFIKTVDKYEIKARYADCESDWKSRLTLKNGDAIIYAVDSLMEFEFKEHTWPDFLNITDTKDQILLEVNDRPYSNYILCLTIDNNSVIKVDKFPLFEDEPMDFDNDGLLEYAGFPLTIEGYTNDSTYYNPIYYIEKGPNGFLIDTTLTRKVNIKLYGEFSGLDASDKVYKKSPADTVDKYLNRRKN